MKNQTHTNQHSFNWLPATSHGKRGNELSPSTRHLSPRRIQLFGKVALGHRVLNLGERSRLALRRHRGKAKRFHTALSCFRWLLMDCHETIIIFNQFNVLFHFRDKDGDRIAYRYHRRWGRRGLYLTLYTVTTRMILH